MTVGSRRYLLGILLVVYTFNSVDRLALGLVMQDIKTDLGLSDTQLGLLTGMAFAFCYAIMGIPIARWADRGNRITIVSLTTALWSAAVVLCSMAGSFLHLLLLRVLTGIGEAGCIPPAHSLIADHFNRAERPRAVGIYMLGAPASGIIGFLVAGWLNEIYGWRTTFVVLGLPGLLLALLVWSTLKEPRLARPPAAAAGVGEVMLVLWRSATFRHLIIFNAVVSFFGFGIGQWLPAFFIRSYGLHTGELGTWLALVQGASGLVGIYWGGAWASRRAANDERLQLRVVALGYCAFGVISCFIYLSPSYPVALALLALAQLGTAVAIGPLYATMQSLVPARMRAMAFAVVYLFGNLIGLGLGPLLAGALSDAFQPWAGDESIRYALLALCPGYVWAAWHLWRASKTVSRDLGASTMCEESKQ